jgi:hypothetical protein
LLEDLTQGSLVSGMGHVADHQVAYRQGTYFFRLAKLSDFQDLLQSTEFPLIYHISHYSSYVM